jgi:hypothetical protein
MPFLFVDYDQGAGGEYFSAMLSASEQCVTLKFEEYENSRIKVFDKFDQEFLKPNAPHPNILESSINLYDIIPTHRLCDLAEKLLGNIQTIRIASPDVDDKTWAFIKYQQKYKVLLSKLSPKLFVGEVKMLARSTVNPNFLKQINIKMDNLDLVLLAKNIEPTKENREFFLNNYCSHIPEPEFNYDLIIPFNDLIFDTEFVKQSILNTFGIKITDNWLDRYRKNYETWLSQT